MGLFHGQHIWTRSTKAGRSRQFEWLMSKNKALQSIELHSALSFWHLPGERKWTSEAGNRAWFAWWKMTALVLWYNTASLQIQHTFTTLSPKFMSNLTAARTGGRGKKKRIWYFSTFLCLWYIFRNPIHLLLHLRSGSSATYVVHYNLKRLNADDLYIHVLLNLSHLL